MTTTAVQLAGVSKTYPHFSLSDIDLEVDQGRVLGFIGPNGAGKSTTIRLIMGLIAPDAGDISVLGHSMPGGQVAAKFDIGFASEDMRLYRSGTLQWHMDFIKSIYPSWDEGYAKKLLKRFDLRPEQKLKGFSHGQRVKAGLLLIIARRPKLMILDEPTTGLDPVARKEVLNELTDVLLDEHRTILFSSHNTRDVEQLSDVITFVDRGRLVDSQDKETFLEKWRRVRFMTPEQFQLPDLPNVVDSHLSGRLATVTTRQFDESLTDTLKSNGAEIQSVDNMTLEEIFVAEIEASRTGEAE